MRTGTHFALAAVLTFSPFIASASEADALAIDAQILAVHLPFGTILDPIYSASNTTTIAGYTRCGDSALWTGAWLAAESFRYNVTQSPDALANVKTALAGLTSLADVTGDSRLARCIVPASSPYAAGIESEEAANTIHQAPPYIWVDNTSRDEVVGAFFGLAVAYDFVSDASVKSGVSALTARLIGFISSHQWSPNDDISNTFLIRPEELQMLLTVANHVDPSGNVSGPSISLPLTSAVTVDTLGLSSYFKFNLDYMSLYNLIRLQDNSANRGAYQIVRTYTASHQNAFFDVIDRALNGPSPARDAETRNLLDEWLARSRRDFTINDSSRVAVCGSEACRPIPVQLRPPADFLWQVDPFQLSGGGSGVVETAGIDYILTYWMARYYGALPPPSNVLSAAADIADVAPDSLASLYGLNLSAGAVVVTDSASTPRQATVTYSSSSQVNLIVPAATASGQATVSAPTRLGSENASATVQSVAPALFTMSGTGVGVAAAIAVRVQAANPQLQSPVTVFQCAAGTCTAVPIALGADTPVYLSLYGTGIRGRNALANVSVTIAGVSATVLYAGPAPGFPGLDQVNVALPLALAGAGESNIALSVDGQVANYVTISIQ